MLARDRRRAAEARPRAEGILNAVERTLLLPFELGEPMPSDEPHVDVAELLRRAARAAEAGRWCEADELLERALGRTP